MARVHPVKPAKIGMTTSENRASRETGADDARNGRPFAPPSSPFEVEEYILGYFGELLKI